MMRQLLNTLDQIVSCDSVGPVRGISRHLGWQVRRALELFPCDLPLSNSTLHVDRPGGVAALVNAMGEYDFNNMRLLKLMLAQRPATFLDVGANIGSYTLVTSEIQQAQIVSIEPHPVTFDLLRRNVALNGRKNITCLNVAVSDSDMELRLSDGDESALNTILGADEHSNRETRVMGRRLDSLCAELGIRPDFIKIDVEGHERAVLDGLGELRTSPRVIFVERGERPEIMEWMRGAGFTGPWFAHYRARMLSSDLQTRAEDPLFVHTEYLPCLRALNFSTCGSLSSRE